MNYLKMFEEFSDYRSDDELNKMVDKTEEALRKIKKLTDGKLTYKSGDYKINEKEGFLSWNVQISDNEDALTLTHSNSNKFFLDGYDFAGTPKEVAERINKDS